MTGLSFLLEGEIQGRLADFVEVGRELQLMPLPALFGLEFLKHFVLQTQNHVSVLLFKHIYLRGVHQLLRLVFFIFAFSPSVLLHVGVDREVLFLILLDQLG